LIGIAFDSIANRDPSSIENIFFLSKHRSRRNAGHVREKSVWSRRRRHTHRPRERRPTETLGGALPRVAALFLAVLSNPSPLAGSARPRHAHSVPFSLAAMAAAARSANHASTSEPPASVVTKSAVFKLGIHPSAMHDALGGAKELLDGMLMRHHHQLGGVLVSYADARLVGSDARIIHQAGYCDVHVRCTARVFCPKPGRKLLGVVNKVGADFVGMLVMGVFNASVSAADISDEFIHNPIDASPGGCWESAEDNGEHRIAVGDEVVFVVKAVSEHDDVLHLLGSLKEEGTGEATRVARAGYSLPESILSGGSPNGDGERDGIVGGGGATTSGGDGVVGGAGGSEGDVATPKKKGKKGKNGVAANGKSSEKKEKSAKKEKKEKRAKKEKKEKRKRED